uniref:Conotoxin reg3a n=1 Tax=Conus regius TaxID=101314 RepID=CM3A_CONRE
MMSKLRVLLTICLLLFPLSALPLDGDQPADQPAKRMWNGKLAARKPRFDKYDLVRGCCPPQWCGPDCTSPCCG